MPLTAFTTIAHKISDQAWGYRGFNLLKDNFEAFYERFIVEHSWLSGRHKQNSIGAMAYATLQGNGSGSPVLRSNTNRGIDSVSRIATGKYRFTWSVATPYGGVAMASIGYTAGSFTDAKCSVCHYGSFTDVYTTNGKGGAAYDLTNSFELSCVVFGP